MIILFCWKNKRILVEKIKKTEIWKKKAF